MVVDSIWVVKMRFPFLSDTGMYLSKAVCWLPVIEALQISEYTARCKGS